MRKFEISDADGSADFGIQLYGDTLEELFIAAAEGLFAIILEKVDGETAEKLHIELKSASIEELLVDWLSELLYHFDANGIIGVRYNLQIKQELKGAVLQGSVSYRSFRPEIEKTAHEVKAVTYYKLRVIRQKGLYSCHVVFDL